MTVAIIFILLFVFMVLGVPIGVCLSLPLLIAVCIDPFTSMSFIGQVFYSGVASFTMLALPFFVLAGAVMDSGGLSRRLVRIANSLIGPITGSLGLVAIIACMFFGAVSGSAPATVAAIGAIMIPEMIRAGYDKYYAVALIATAGSLGVIVPPSYPMVIYGVTFNVSIGDLFIAGIGPAVVVGAILAVINYAYCKKHGYKGTQKLSIREFALAVKDGFPALLMPVIILGGIYGGVFSATEAAVVAVVYGIVVGKFWYRELTIRELFPMFRSNTIFVGGTMLTLAPATALGTVLNILGVTSFVGNFFIGLTDNEYIVILVCVAILFIAGMFIQTTPVIVILGPILYAALEPYGMDPIQYGLFLVLALSIAFITPPVAANLFMASSMTGISINRLTPQLIKFMIGLCIALFIVAVFPQVSLFLIS